VIKTLKDHGPIDLVPDVNEMMNKIEIYEKSKTENIDLSPIIQYFFEPLQNSYINVTKELNNMNEEGVNRIKIGTKENTTITDLINTMCKKEMIANFMAGTELKREQLVYWYESIKLIWETELKDSLKDEIGNIQSMNLMEMNLNSIIRSTIPKLLVFRLLKDRVKVLKQLKIEKKSVTDLYLDDTSNMKINEKEDFLSQKVKVKYGNTYEDETTERLWLFSG